MWDLIQWVNSFNKIHWTRSHFTWIRTMKWDLIQGIWDLIQGIFFSFRTIHYHVRVGSYYRELIHPSLAYIFRHAGNLHLNLEAAFLHGWSGPSTSPVNWPQRVKMIMKMRWLKTIEQIRVMIAISTWQTLAEKVIIWGLACYIPHDHMAIHSKFSNF